MAFQRTTMNAGLVALLGFITVCPLACGQAAPPPQIVGATIPPAGQTAPYKGPFPCPFPSGNTVILSDPDAPDATIFFTTNAVTEAAQVKAAGTTYNNLPLQINQAGPVTLTAVASSPHYPQISPLATWTFNCPRTTPPPQITGLSSPPAGQNPPYTGNLPCPVPNGGTVLPQQVTMLDPDTAAVIFFTFVPNAIPSPNAAGTVIYGGPFLMNQTGAVILTAAAQAPNYPQSAAMHWAFNCPSVLPPTFSPQPIATAVSACPLQVTINTNNTEWGSGVFVTTNRTMPSPQQNMQVAGNLTGQVAVTVPVTSKGVPNQTTTTTLGAISCIANGLYCSPPVLNQKYTCPGPPPSFDRMNITIGTGNDQLKSGTELTGTLTTAGPTTTNICLHPSEQLPPDNFCPSNGPTTQNNGTNNTWSNFNTPVSENVNVATAQALTSDFQTLTLTMNQNGCGVGANNWALQSIKVQVWDSKSRSTTTQNILNISEPQLSSNANNCFVHLKCNSPGNTITFNLPGNGTNNPQPTPVCNQGGS